MDFNGFHWRFSRFSWIFMMILEDLDGFEEQF